MNLRVLCFFVLTLIFSVVSYGQEISVQPAVAETKQPKNYLIGPGDVIEGKVLGEDDFAFKATVDEDGNIEVPFFDQPVMAKCRSERELRADVTKLLSKYLRNPLVSVNIVGRNSRPPATIYGEVRAAAPVILTRKTTLLELLSFSGGVTEKAGGTVRIFRTQAPLCANADELADYKESSANGVDVPSQMYSLSSVRQGKDGSNPLIYPGDVIVVDKAPPVYVVGEVSALKEIFLTETGLSLSEALAQAGGVNRDAKVKDIKIRRLKPNSKEREIISVNYDLVRKGQQKDQILEPNDIVEVGKSKKSIAQTVLELAMGSARGATQLLPQRIMY